MIRQEAEAALQAARRDAEAQVESARKEQEAEKARLLQAAKESDVQRQKVCTACIDQAR